MATAILPAVKAPGPSSRSPTSKARQYDSPEASSSRYPQPAAVADVFGSPPTPEPPSRSFHKFRSSLEQSLRTATRSKKLPAPPVDEFANRTDKTKKGKEKETQALDDSQKDRMKMFRKVTFRKGDRDSPVHDESSRVAGHTSFITPSMRLASMSSPALHLSSQALPSPTSQSAVNASSASNTDILVSPSRSRTRRISLQAPARDISNPLPLSSPTPRHRSSKSAPIAIPPSPSSPSLVTTSAYASRASPTPTRTRPPPVSTNQASSHRPISPRASSNAGTPAARAASPSTPIRARSPTAARVRVASPARGINSSSTSHLPSASSPSPTPRRSSNDASRRPVLDSPRRPSGESPRRLSFDAGNRARESPTPFRADSPPASPISPRARTPSQRAYAQNRLYNISSGSLLLPPSNPEHRELIRTATSMLCREIIKAPAHMMKSDQGIRDWEEVEYRTRSLARLERIWGRSGVTNGSPTGSAPAMGSAGEERERRSFCEALRDGYVLCQ